MLLKTLDLLEIPIMSLQTGSEIAHTITTIIDSRKLHILAYELEGSQLDERPSFIRIEDIRELSDIGFIVDSSDSLTILDDLVVDRRYYENPLRLEGMKVVDSDGKKLGKVDYATTNTSSFHIEQISIRQPFFKSITDTNLLIGRQQIISVSDNTITVRTPKEIDKQSVKIDKQPFINPFRGHVAPQPESAKSDRH